MIGFLGAAYPWVLAAHVIFVIFLMASLFMMPRFFVYHHQTVVGSPEDKAWIDREDRLRRIIMNPSLIIIWVLGIALALNIDAFSQGWFHVKLLLVIILSGYHGWASGYSRKLARGQRPLSEKALRLLNEVPGILVSAVVITVIIYGPHHGFG
ncbi:protoporphyrinogen oxidase HemJ [soil metagenome]